MVDMTTILLGGLAWLLFKGQEGRKAPLPGAPSPPAEKPSTAPWPGRVEPMNKGVPAVHDAAERAAAATAPTGPMQKGIPGVHRAAQHAVDVLREQQEFGQGTGTGTRHYRPATHATPTQVQRARQLLPGWKPGMRWRDADDPSVMYVAKTHGKKRAVEVWTSSD